MPHERLRDILPLLRPRSAEPTLFSQTVFYLLCLSLVVLVSLYALRRYRLRQRREREFRAQAEALGLQEEDMALVQRVARQRNLPLPQRLLTSARTFDRHMGGHAWDLARRDLRHPGLAHIARLRRSLGFDELPRDQALNSTRQLERGQTLMVWEDWHEEEQYSPWLVLDLDEGSLAVVPILRGEEEHEDHVEVGHQLSVRFWREGDTEYRFRARILHLDAGSSSYLLEHANRVERLQQRDFFRIAVDFPVSLYALPNAGAMAEQPGLAAEGAAMMLLDSQPEDAHGDAIAPPPPAFVTAGEDSAAPLDLDQLERLDGQAADLGAGGMAVLVSAGSPLRPQRWLVDPEFTGALPLAGVVCQLIDEVPEGDRVRVKLRFEALSPAAESEIVRQVYQHQILEAGGRDADSRGEIPTAPPEAPLPEPTEPGPEPGP